MDNSEKKFRFLFDYSSDLIFLSDLHGDFIEINKVACDLLEYEKEELLRMNFKDIKTPKYKQLVKDNIKKTIEKRKYTYETEHVTKRGVVFPYEMSSRIVDYDDQRVIISVGRNISERKAFEKKLLGTIIATEEKERKRFAADLHDGLSPILSTLKLYTDLLKNDQFSNTSKEEVINNIEELADMAISTAKEIAMNITPNILHDFGLATAINEFCNYVNATKSIKIRAKTAEYTIDERSVVETVLYQTVQELINNTLKHSQAENVVIDLKSTENQIILYYKDDGIGFDVDDQLHNSGGLGLNNIVNKIKTIKGACDFYSKKEGGMVLLISVRLK